MLGLPTNDYRRRSCYSAGDDSARLRNQEKSKQRSAIVIILDLLIIRYNGCEAFENSQNSEFATPLHRSFRFAIESLLNDTLYYRVYHSLSWSEKSYEVHILLLNPLLRSCMHVQSNSLSISNHTLYSFWHTGIP